MGDAMKHRDRVGKITFLGSGAVGVPAPVVRPVVDRAAQFRGVQPEANRKAERAMNRPFRRMPLHEKVNRRERALLAMPTDQMDPVVFAAGTIVASIGFVAMAALGMVESPYL